MLIDVPYHTHHGHRFEVPNLDTRQVGRAHLLESALYTESLNLVEYWIKLLAKLVCSLCRTGLELYEPSDEDVHIKNLGILVGLETQPVYTPHLRRVWFIKTQQYRESTWGWPDL